MSSRGTFLYEVYECDAAISILNIWNRRSNKYIEKVNPGIDNRTRILYNSAMTLWQKLKEVKEITGGADVLNGVKTLADELGCGEDEMILKLLDQALRTNQNSERTRRCWESLSYREKQVAALVCSGLTGRQTAAHLVLSPETVKTHVRHILRKFNLNSRRDLRNILSDWDLSRWLRLENALMIADSYANYHAPARRELCSADVVYDEGK